MSIDDPTFRTVYLKLDEAAFRSLVCGDEAVLVSQDGTIQAHLILADIGWERMTRAIFAATWPRVYALSEEHDADLRLRIGRQLGDVRVLRGISQEQAARDLNISRPRLSNIEQGRSKTNWTSLNEMAKYYGYSIRALIDKIEAEMPTPSPE